MISYAQNFEDVILWRALKSIPNGFYIDIGAQDPVIDSISRAFYEAGWRGVHVEPSPRYAAKLRQERPDEAVLEWAIGSAETQIPFFHFPDTGLSTGIADIAKGHQTAGFRMEEISVDVKTTAQLLDTYADRDIHWMKIDCEGMESDIIEGWVASSVRPWIVLIESVLPTSHITSHENWEPLILSLEYDFVYTDGLNRFYLSKKREDLRHHFGAGPNLFDGFASTHFNLALQASAREIAAQRGVLAKVRAEIEEERQTASALTQARRLTLEAVQLQTEESLQRLKGLESDRTYVARLYEGRLKEKDALIAAERVRTTEFEGAQARLEERLNQAVLDASDWRRELEHAHSEIAFWRANAQSWQAQTQMLIASTSWKIALPIRVLKRALRRFLGRAPTTEVYGFVEPIKPEARAEDLTSETAFLEPPMLPPKGLRTVRDLQIEGASSPIFLRAQALLITLKGATAASDPPSSETP